MGIKKVLSRVIRHFDLNELVNLEPAELIEYDLLNFNEDLDKAWEKINALYDKILHKDNYWHLFYEGTFSTLRISPQYIDKVEKFFRKHDIEYKCNGAWTDGSPTVEKYKKMYRDMFHAFSELAIHLDEEDLFHASDRVCHSFFNHAFYAAKEHRAPFEKSPSAIGPTMWEADMMSRVLIYRAHHIGMYDMERHLAKRFTLVEKSYAEEKDEELKNKYQNTSVENE